VQAGRQQLEKCASEMKTVSLIRQRPHGSTRKNGNGDREHVAARGEVYLIQLDPTRGSEIRKTRPCLIVSPDELNDHLRTVIVAPMTTGGQAYPWRVQCRFQGRTGFVAMDQLRTVDVERLVRRLGRLAPNSVIAALTVVEEMFTP
jgi:mRNA interferase MazF